MDISQQSKGSRERIGNGDGDGIEHSLKAGLPGVLVYIVAKEDGLMQREKDHRSISSPFSSLTT